MSDIHPEIDQLEERIEKSKAPAVDFGVQLLPVSHQEFQARWSLSEQTLDAGLRAASHSRDGAHLVLRAYSLPMGADQGDFSSVWHDFGIDGTENSAYFSLPGPAEKIKAAIGLINQSGRFSPLVRSEPVALPAPPAPPAAKTEVPPAAQAPQAEASPGPPETSHHGSSTPLRLNEREITERLEALTGLPHSLKSSAAVPADAEDVEDAAQGLPTGRSRQEAAPHAASAASEPHRQLLNEAETLQAVRHKMALEPEPAIPERQQEAPAAENASVSPTNRDPESGASEQLASQWEALWAGNAPVELRAEYVLSGRIAPGMKLLLGNEILEPKPGGFILWKRKLETFNQVWPLLDAALTNPSVDAGPSLEFFQGVRSADRMLELHAALEIEGKVSDAAYHSRLPAGLDLSPDGTFKLNRMLPYGAVILPGLSLIAG